MFVKEINVRQIRHVDSFLCFTPHISKISSKASGHLTSSFTTDKFVGMELLQYRGKKPQVITTKNCRTKPRSPGIPQSWTTLIPGGEISRILLSQKRFLSINIKHRQSQTMFGWTTRFYEAMIKNKLEV
jgi:hypothetical protein